MKYWSNSLLFSLVCACLPAGTALAEPTPAKTPSGTAALKSDMRSVYATAEELYGYVWNPERFANPEEKEKIQALLNTLSGEFHKVGKDAGAASSEPGFAVILATQQRMLKDISRRFADGSTDYANWQLRGVLANCTACHSRVAAPFDFVGDAPKSESKTFAQRLAAAEFLFASRQFDNAAGAFFTLAKDESDEEDTTSQAIEALKQWLLIQVRVKDKRADAAKALDSLGGAGKFSEEQRELLKRWSSDLEKIATSTTVTDASALGTMESVKKLLAPVMDSGSIQEHETHLVTTLFASTVLHEELEKKLSLDQRREALCVLGHTYSKIPIQSLESFGSMHLEACIREYPGTPEASAAFTLFKEQIEFYSSGSGGVHLEPEDEKLLKELEQLATVKATK